MKKTPLNPVPFFKAAITAAEEKAVLDVLRSGWLTSGKKVLRFEKDFSRKINMRSEKVKNNRSALSLSNDPVISLAVNSNTNGLLLAYEACGVGKNTAIITTPYTFVSTALCARHLGADVFFADIEETSYNIDAKSVEKILRSRSGKKVKAIVAVHIGGNVCDMKALVALAKKYKVFLIEDAAHSFPSRTSLGYAGTIADAGVFSFYATKPITTGEGGMVCTRSKTIAKRIESMRMHGMNRNAWDRYTDNKASWEYDIVAPGFKCNLPDVLAAIGIEQLKKADALFEKRKKIAKLYTDNFSKLPFFVPPPDDDGNAWHLYLLRINEKALSISRNEFAQKLQDAGIGITVNFIPLFHFTYWKNLYPGFTKKKFPNAEKKYQTTVTLPLWPDMNRETVFRVIETVKEIGERYAR